MNAEDFNQVLVDRITDLQDTLSMKGNEYAKGKDRLSNFKDAAFMNGIQPEQALWGFVSKHIIALKDFINQVDDNVVTYSQWEEKLADIIAYMVLLDGLIKERGVK